MGMRSREPRDRCYLIPPTSDATLKHGISEAVEFDPNGDFRSFSLLLLSCFPNYFNSLLQES